MKKRIRVGSRDSKLAVMQTKLVMNQIKELRPDWDLELITMKTTGDKILNQTLDKIGGKGLFVKELHQALLQEEIDIAIHSLKDMPMEEDPQIPISAYIKRGDPRDCLVCRPGILDESGIMGTSSARRKLQLKGMGKEKEKIKSIRGNIVTRLKKLDDGAFDALILAAAGLIRAGLGGRITKYYEPHEMLPAAGQGILAVQCREGFEPELMKELNDEETMYAALAERGFVRTLNGGCSSPVAAYAQIKGDMVVLEGLYYDGESGHFWKKKTTGKKEEAENIGISLAMEMKTPGKVWLIGAGPSDPGLMTLKGKEVLEKADVVVFDHLIGEGIRQMIPKRAQVIDAGKEAGMHKMKQEEINRILLCKALEGKRVVRLKGGDPFLFGRGAEELELLANRNIPFEVIPGVTSALSVPAYAGIPITHRDISSSVHIIAGQRKQGNQEIDFHSLATLAHGTLVFLMGVSQLEYICKGLMEAGLRGETKAAIVERGTTSKQKSVFGTLETLPELARKENIGRPGIIVVGEVCKFGSQFGWVEKRPLHGMRIWITRPEKKESRLAEMLYDLGAEILKVPSIETKSLKDFPYLKKVKVRLEKYNWMVFTSQTSVHVFYSFLKQERIDIRQLRNVRFAAVGKATAESLMDKGITPDFVPEYSNGKVMAEGLEKLIEDRESILVFTPQQEPGEVALELDKKKISFDRIPLYETKIIGHKEVPVMEGDLFAFASASAVRGMVLGRELEEWKGKVAVCIGEKTAEEARKCGFSVIVSKDTTMESMVQTFLKIAEKGTNGNK